VTHPKVPVLERHRKQPTPWELANGRPCAYCRVEANAKEARARLVDPTGLEQWRSVVGYEGLYSVSTLGRLRSDRPKEGGRLLSQIPRDDMRLGVRLVKDKIAKDFRVARLVADAFLGPKPVGQEINHIDGDHSNNAVANLEYVTKEANEAHAKENALHAWGDRHGMAKLTRENVRYIRSSSETAVALAARFGVGDAAIQEARLGKTWRHLDTPVDVPHIADAPGAYKRPPRRKNRTSAK
jgi:hypothetical protein